MKQNWHMSNWTLEQMERRDFEPEVEEGCIINGCIPQDDYAEQIFEELEAEAVSFGTVWELGNMPVLKMDDAFRTWRKDQIEQCKALVSERITCLLPWQVLKHLPAERKKSNRLYFTQGGRPSCSGHADAFAHHSTTLQLIARGAPLVYSSFNPIVTWAITKGGSIRGGQSISEQAKGANGIGHFPEELVGTNNQSVPSYKAHLEAAKLYQSAILFLNFRGKELADEIIQSCAAGLSVALGNSTAVSGSTVDSNGVKVATIRGSWAHACLESTQKVYTTEGIKSANELVGNTFYTLSYSKRKGRVAVKSAFAWNSGVKECVRISTNIGTFVVTTDHPVMLHDGRFVKAQSLNIGDRMFQMSSMIDEKGYARVTLHDGRNGKCRLHRLIGTDILNADPDDVVHHRDEDVLNNAIDNLAVTTRGSHSSEHASVQLRSAESNAKRSRTMNRVLERGLVGTGYRSPKWKPADTDAYSDRYHEEKRRVTCIKVESIEHVGLKDIVSIEVVDPEPDDKRDWSEHNYMLCPEETTNLYAAHGIASGNTHFTGYRVVNGTEYVGWVNSHGSRYKTSDEGEPADMCWMTRSLVEQFVSTASGYGSPYVVIPESVFHLDRSLYVKLRVPFPANWRF